MSITERIDAHAAELARNWPELTDEQITIVRAAFATARTDGGSR